MIKNIQGNRKARGVKLALILPRFNESIGIKLVDGAKKAYVKQGGNVSDLTLVRVPGAFEIPLSAKKLIETKKFDAIIALGVLLKGKTYHFKYVARVLTDGIRQVMLETGTPIIFEVLIADSIELARKRAQADPMNNKGYSSVLAALEMVHLFRSIEK